MQKRLVLSKKGKRLLILFLVVLDVVCIFVLTPIFDGKTFASYNGKYSYDDLFSSKTESVDIGNIIKVLAYNNNSIETIDAKNLLNTICFEAISPNQAIPIMILYNPKNKLCTISTLASGSVLDDNMITDDAIFEIANKKGYIVKGTVFVFNKSVYMFAIIKDDSYVYDDKDSPRKNAIRSTMAVNNRTVALFKLNDIDEGVILDKFSQCGVLSYTKPYPNWYSYLQDFPLYTIIVIAIFLCKNGFVFWLANKRVRVNQETR